MRRLPLCSFHCSSSRWNSKTEHVCLCSKVSHMWATFLRARTRTRLLRYISSTGKARVGRAEVMVRLYYRLYNNNNNSIVVNRSRLCPFRRPQQLLPPGRSVGCSSNKTEVKATIEPITQNERAQMTMNRLLPTGPTAAAAAVSSTPNLRRKRSQSPIRTSTEWCSSRRSLKPKAIVAPNETNNPHNVNPFCKSPN